MTTLFDLQGHRGARGLKPENTLPSFEAAFDLGVTSVETDLHLSRDGVPILYHDATITERLCRLLPGSDAPDPAQQPLVSTLTLDQIRGYRADRNPDPRRFPDQDARVTPLARVFAEQRGIDPYTPPTLADLLAFAAAYTGPLGTEAGKTPAQQTKVRRVRFDLELKRVPFYPHIIGDTIDGVRPGRLEERLLEIVLAAGVVERTAVRSFDHRCIRTLRQREPRLRAAVLIAETAPVSPEVVARQADAEVYACSFDFLDEAQVRQMHAAGVSVAPWTVNGPEAWRRLLDWGVDGITTDYPDRLADLLRSRGVPF